MSKQTPGAHLRIAVLGIDHRHIFGMLGGLLDMGATAAGWHTEGDPPTLPGFVRRFPDLPRLQDPDELLADPSVNLALIAAVPDQRAELAVRAMRAGKDVMVDKPGCTTAEQLELVRACVAETARIWSINFSERFEVPATAHALELVRQGAIGNVVQVLGLGPHRLNAGTRPDWFFDLQRAGSILSDIGCHQIDQFLAFADAKDAEIEFASMANLATPQHPTLMDFGQVALRSGQARGYFRLDWRTPDGLPTWGDGRLFVMGSDGYIEVRKYVDVGGKDGTDHLFLVDGKEVKRIDCSKMPNPYFAQLAADVRDRTETAVSQQHTLKVMELALRAETVALEAES